MVFSILEMSDKDINVLIRHGDGTCGFCVPVVLPSMPMIARSFCGFARKLDASFPQVSRKFPASMHVRLPVVFVVFVDS